MAIKVKLQDMGVKVTKPDYGEPVESSKTKTKTKVEYPEITLNSKNLPGLEKLSKDSKCHLMFVGEVVSIAEPEDYLMTREGLTKEDVVVKFRLKDGEIMPAGGDSKTYGEASIKAGK